jgi:hypothetical protein
MPLRYAVALCIAGFVPAIAAAQPAAYVDMPLPELRKAIPALADLQPEEDSANLYPILDAIGNQIQQSMPRLPNLLSREIVYRSQVRSGQDAPQHMIAVSGGATGVVIAPQGVHPQEFRYIILSHRTAAGVTLEESRTDPRGHPVNQLQADKDPLGTGFAYQWLLFASSNQPEFRFRYLGQQTIRGHKTDVIAFAQIPDRVRFPAIFAWRGKQASYYYQGILWADAASSQILLLRTDLLSPLPQMQLHTLTTELHFGPVHISGYDPGEGAELWLPQDVHLTIAQDRFDIDELHRYSDYHLYHSQATILPAQ